jgi:hypothetical protein
MDTSNTGLRHPLDALLKKRQWERDALAMEAVLARRIWEERNGAHQAVLDLIAGAESQLRQLYQAPAGIALDRRHILEMFLKHQHEVAHERQQAATSAHTLYAQVMVQLDGSRVAVKVLEKHGERTMQAHDQGERRREQRVADDMWLLRRGSR